MAARKLQAEIDRTFKRIAEGVELFEATFDKLKDASANASGPGGNPAQVKKLEAELKSQIKKLQRHRDQLKSWIAGSDIKDKKSLLEQRELIETQMERFKATEKEMKTKAFSKEGLTAAAKLDPKEKLKMETINWISEQVDHLAQQIEHAEAEVETLQVVTKKGKKETGKGERLVQLEAQNERRKWHVDKLEQVNRKLENGDLDVDDVVGIKDNVGYYVESNVEEGELGEDDTFYDDLDLEDEDGALGAAGAGGAADDDASDGEDLHSKMSSSPAAQNLQTSMTAAKPTLAATASSSNLSANNKNRKTSGTGSAQQEEDKEETTRPVTRTTRATSNATRKSSVGADSAPLIKPGVNLPPLPQISQSQVNKATTSVPTTQSTSLMANHVGIPKLATQPAPQPIRYAAAAAANGSKVTKAPLPPVQTNPLAQQKAEQTAPAATMSGVTSGQISASVPTVSAAPAQAAPTSTPASAPAPAPAPLPTAPDVAKSAATPLVPPKTGAAIPAKPVSAVARDDVPEAVRSDLGEGAPALRAPDPPKAVSAEPPKSEEEPAPMPTPVTLAKSLPQNQMPSRLPQTLSDLLPSYESARSKSIPLAKSLSQHSTYPQEELSALDAALLASMKSAPEPSDADKPKYYTPKNPMTTPDYYPQSSLTSFEDPRIFEKMEVDTLFFIFYYMQGTYQQYLAAKELKKQSWRFHKKYVTWFQRHEEPKMITDEYEQGVYIYFDWEQVWCQRKKADFRFEYKYLEDVPLP